MDPEEKRLLERTVKLSEENHKILRSMQRRMRWAFFWSIVKLVILIVPFVVGYLYLEPYFGSIGDALKQAQSLLQAFP